MQDLEERTVGVLLGLAAGDRIGGPIRMALRIAKSLRDCDGIDVSDIGMRYLATGGVKARSIVDQPWLRCCRWSHPESRSSRLPFVSAREKAA